MSLADVMKDFNKKFKEDLVHQGVAEYNYERIPFTSPRLNYMTFGGVPKGKLIEFYGEEHGGKTTTALDIVANFQHSDDNRKVLWVDCENSLDAVWATKLGVSLEDMIIVNPTSQGAEEIFQFILDSIDTGEVGIVVIDSLGVMVSNQAMEKEVADKTYGGISMALTQFSKKAEGLCQRHKCTLIGINQMRDDMNSHYGGTTTTGGRAWKHNVIARFEFRLGNYIDEKNNKLTRGAENPAGNIVNVLMKKNKTCPPTRRVGFYTLKYSSGIDYLSDLIEVAIKYGIIEKAGAWFTIVDINTGEIIKDKLQGYATVTKTLGEDTELLSAVEELVDCCMEKDENLDEDIE
jgi:recombination protein RecA